MIDILPTEGREVLAEELAKLPYLFALSAGDPAWDASWGGLNEPAPGMDDTEVLNLLGYARPTVTGFVVPDVTGAIYAESGTRYAVSSTITRFLRVRLSVPAGHFGGQTIREIGLFVRPTIDSDVPSGQTVIPSAKVSAAGDLLLISRFRPQYLTPATSVSRNFIVRL